MKLTYCHCYANRERELQAEDIAAGLVDIECDCVDPARIVSPAQLNAKLEADPDRYLWHDGDEDTMPGTAKIIGVVEQDGKYLVSTTAGLLEYKPSDLITLY